MIPNSLKFTYLLILIIFGYDVGFSKIFKGKIRVYIKYTSLLVSIVSLIIFLSAIPYLYKYLWYWAISSKYVISVLALKRAQYGMYDFFKDLHVLGRDVSGINSNVFGIVFMAYTFSFFASKFVLLVACSSMTLSSYCSQIKNSLHRGVFYFFLCFVDTSGGSIIVIVFYVYCFAKKMKDILKSTKNWIEFENRYVALADCFEKIQPFYNAMILIELFINIPRLMVTLWCMLLYIKENAEWYSYTCEWLFAFHISTQMCIPAVLAEMVNCQMDYIRMMLNEQLRLEKDKEKSEDIIRILRYIKARRLQNDIWRVIPVDLRLPLSMFSLCTTYFIVILQLTHLYD